MVLLGIDLGGTKLATAVFTENGFILKKDTIPLNKRQGTEVGQLITGTIKEILDASSKEGYAIDSIGISVPGIIWSDTGRVWAPNIPGWEDYPLHNEIKVVSGTIPVVIDSDRTCYIMGEVWQGNAYKQKDAIFLSIGTGIGAGILVNGEVLRGSQGIAGAVGWMALQSHYLNEYAKCGCFEFHASGSGIAALVGIHLESDDSYNGCLSSKPIDEITAEDVFEAYKKDDPVALYIIKDCIKYWGMAVANLVSIFNPRLIIMGGGLFGPAWSLIKEIMDEASKWAQPVSIRDVEVSHSALGGDAGVYGAGYMALKNYRKLNLK